MKVTVHAPAKINLALDILGKREDGYHLVEMVMQAVDLYDTVIVSEKNHQKIELVSDYLFDVEDSRNTAYRAADVFFLHLGIQNPGIKIKIKKRIPVAAGLAGGSTDAAAVLLALDHLFGTDCSRNELTEMGEKIGADVPFCLFGGTMTAEGTGTILTPTEDLPECYFVLAKPPISVSTKEAYAKADETSFIDTMGITRMVDAIYSGELKNISKAVFNRFEEVMKLEEVSMIKEKMKEQGALQACMSGSGPTVFGIFSDWFKAESCAYKLKHCYHDVFICRPVSHGCVIL